MLDASQFRVCHAEQLKEGEVAHLSVFGGSVCFVGQIGGRLAAVRLNQTGQLPDWVYVENLNGQAVVVNDVKFEISPDSITEAPITKGMLVRSQDKLFILTSGVRLGLVAVAVAHGLEDTKGVQYHFSAWRALVEKAHGGFVLFERHG